jgi:hypothetical protein
MSHETTAPATAMKWSALVALAMAQFVMVLDQSVMNVSISALVEDFDTTVTTIQGVITLYSLVMAMSMMTGAKIGDIIGRRRAFVIGLVIYGIGSAITAVAPTVAILTFGQLRGAPTQSRVRGYRRCRRCRYRHRPDLGRVGHDRVHLAHRLRWRSRARADHLGHDRQDR